MTFPFSEVLKQSWQTAWKTKLFWLFGLFSGGGFMFFWFSDEDIQNTKKLLTKEGLDSVTAGNGWPVGMLWVLAALFFLGLIFGAISFLARAAFLRGLGQGQSGVEFRFSELIKFGWRRMWRLWGIDLILGLVNIPLVGVLILLAVSVGNNNALPFGLFATTVIIMIIYNLGIWLFKHYVHCFAVLADEKAWSAIKSGWQLLVKNLGVSVVARLIEVGVLIVSGLAIFISIFILAIPFVIIGIVLGLTVGPVGVGIIAVIALLALFAYIIVLRGLVNAFMFTYLTRVYWRLKSGANGSAENDGKSVVDGSAKLR